MTQDYRFLDALEASTLLTLMGTPRSPSTLRKLRCVGNGPTFAKFGRQVVYREDWLREWVLSRMSLPMRSTSEATPPVGTAAEETSGTKPVASLQTAARRSVRRPDRPPNRQPPTGTRVIPRGPGRSAGAAGADRVEGCAQGGCLAVELATGIVFNELKLTTGANGPWIAMPVQKQFDRHGDPRFDANGKPIFSQIIEFGDRATADRFAAMVLDLIRASHPDVLR